ncbi:uncharacterized protein PAC_08855 [Phialocephala subalpina]|uniref:Uncharacterized protein n=1 Tax=Phialocephala subalpina TaxID=576137 RepID=A0A1L7X1Q2_9HELO|nr:uncharacterized protein PAC_08855 [Phialocephala subalpina]
MPAMWPGPLSIMMIWKVLALGISRGRARAGMRDVTPVHCDLKLDLGKWTDGGRELLFAVTSGHSLRFGQSRFYKPKAMISYNDSKKHYRSYVRITIDGTSFEDAYRDNFVHYVAVYEQEKSDRTTQQIDDRSGDNERKTSNGEGEASDDEGERSGNATIFEFSKEGEAARRALENVRDQERHLK